MTDDRARSALARARDDFEHHTRAALEAESDRARRRHVRKAQTAQSRMAGARRDLARLACVRFDAFAY